MSVNPTRENDGNVYVPLSERKEQPKPNYSNMPFPWFLPETRKKVANWYPGPTIMMHKMHWTEWVFVILTAASAVMVAAGANVIPVSVFAIAGMIYPLNTLVFIWGVAKYQSLSEAADRLEAVAMAQSSAIGAISAINDDWEKGIEQEKQNIEAFANELGLLEGGAADIDAVQKQLKQIVLQKKKILAEEKAMFQVSVKYQIMSRARITEKQRKIAKSMLAREFNRLDNPQRGYLQGREAIETMRVHMDNSEFLNRVDEDGNPLYDWVTHYERITAEGTLKLDVLMDTIDDFTESLFHELKDSIAQAGDLEEELRDLQTTLRQKQLEAGEEMIDTGKKEQHDNDAFKLSFMDDDFNDDE